MYNSAVSEKGVGETKKGSESFFNHTVTLQDKL